MRIQEPSETNLMTFEEECGDGRRIIQIRKDAQDPSVAHLTETLDGTEVRTLQVQTPSVERLHELYNDYIASTGRFDFDWVLSDSKAPRAKPKSRKKSTRRRRSARSHSKRR